MRVLNRACNIKLGRLIVQTPPNTLILYSLEH